MNLKLKVMRATSSSFLLHDNPFFFLNDRYGCDMWSYLVSIFFSALLNVANMILNLFWGEGGGVGVGRKGQQKPGKAKMNSQ